MIHLRSIGVSVSLMLAVACTTYRTAKSQHASRSLGTDQAPPISCSAPAQQEFENAVILLHHMTYPQARESFRKVVAVDSSCAMGYWGVAMTLFQPMWPTQPGPADLRLGWEMTQKATSAPRQTQR